LAPRLSAAPNVGKALQRRAAPPAHSASVPPPASDKSDKPKTKKVINFGY
jgi:hypothetical protein